jgi:hypothetical protein
MALRPFLHFMAPASGMLLRAKEAIEYAKKLECVRVMGSGEQQSTTIARSIATATP